MLRSNKFLFVPGSAAVGAALGNPPTPQGSGVGVHVRAEERDAVERVVMRCYGDGGCGRPRG